MKQLTKPHLHLVGLGCGGGKKEAELLRLAAPSIPSLKYTPTDVSTAMCTVAYEEAQKLRLPNLQLEPGVVWDMETTSDWGKPLSNEAIDEGTRCYTFFGMLPNFEPDLAFDRLSALLRPGDFLLASANLAPGANYLEGIHSVIGGYDNPLCHEWLRQILIDHEIDDAGTLRFQISSPRTLHKLRRIEAIFELQRDIRLDLEGQRVTAKAKTEILLFYSYRYQLKQIQTICRSKGLELLSTQSNPGQTEAVFLCRKESS